MDLVRQTYNNKEKIKDVYKIILINNYMNTVEEITTHKFNVGNLLVVNYYDINPSVLHSLEIRPETVFKINIKTICSQIKKLFSNININIDVSFEVPSETGKKYRTHTYIHDVLVKITNKNNTYEIGYEYNESGHSSNVNRDNIKNIYSTMCLDSYNVYYEKDNNYVSFMNNIIYEMLVTICSLKNLKYKLAKIFYFKNKENINTNEEDDLNTILTCKKNNKVSIKYLYDTFCPYYKNSDDENIEYEYNEYLEHLKNELEIKIVDEQCIFNDLLNILCTDLDVSNNSMVSWNRIFTHSMNKLIEASDEIIKLNNKMNRKKDLMQPFIEDIIKNLHRYPNNSIAMIGISNYLRERGHTHFSNVDIINIFDLTINNKVEALDNNNIVSKLIEDYRDTISEIIKKYQKTTTEKKVSEKNRIKIVSFLDKVFQNDKDNVFIDINKKREMKKIFYDWDNKYYHNAGERKCVFDLLESILVE
jgi:hypothetical protein